MMCVWAARRTAVGRAGRRPRPRSWRVAPEEAWRGILRQLHEKKEEKEKSSGTGVGREDARGVDAGWDG